MINLLAALLFLILVLGGLLVCFAINFSTKQKVLAKLIELKEKEKEKRESEIDKFEEDIEKIIQQKKRKQKIKRRTIYDPQEPSW